MACCSGCVDGGREAALPGVSVAERLGPGAVSAPSCRELGVPQPQEMWVAQDAHRSEFTSVIYGFVLLLSTPTPVCVHPTPALPTVLETAQCCALLGGFPLAALARGPSELSGRSEPEKGG